MLDGQVGPEPCIPDWGVMLNSPCLSPWLLRPASCSQQPLHLLEGHLFTQQTFVYTYGVPETLVGTGATAGTERGFGRHAAHVPEGGGRACWVRGEAARTSAEVRGPLGGNSCSSPVNMLGVPGLLPGWPRAAEDHSGLETLSSLQTSKHLVHLLPG